MSHAATAAESDRRWTVEYEGLYLAGVAPDGWPTFSLGAQPIVFAMEAEAEHPGSHQQNVAAAYSYALADRAADGPPSRWMGWISSASDPPAPSETEADRSFAV